jgi:hypothetical protein
VVNFPANDVEGNDDTSTGDESNDPYSNGGTLSGQDLPVMAVADRGGSDGNTFEFRMQFGEFTRLEIQGVWYRISDFYPWRCHLKFVKVGNFWINNGSSIALDNAGF